MKHIPRAAALAVAGALVPLVVGCASHQQGRAERADHRPTATTSKSASSPDCGPESNLSQSDWMDQCADSTPTADDQPQTELAIGDAFAFNDGVKVTVSSLREITSYGEWDDKPGAGQTAFRVTWTISNGTDKPLDLDQWGESEEGATSGGQVDILSVEKGSRPMAGRIAPGKAGTFTDEGAINDRDGKEIVVTVTRMDDDADMLAEDPHWTGTIK
ncbi:hypothetical protein AB0M87_04550 [Streptomyces sp. NPDC051320]|uniref:hypothetical protein n=1 Tax=Streptomyces sp. NPDC051320 TaxID=3154644 RepID=UPI00342F3D3B